MKFAKGYSRDSLSRNSFIDSMNQNWEDDIDWEAKLEGVEHLVVPEGSNYNEEDGYGYLEPVDTAISMAKEAFGNENQIREYVVDVRDYLMDLGRMKHANQLDQVLVSPGVGRGKLSCREVKGGNGRHPGNPDGKKQGPAGTWNRGSYEDHGVFQLKETDDELWDYIL